jgi:hypothetical protein
LTIFFGLVSSSHFPSWLIMFIGLVPSSHITSQSHFCWSCFLHLVRCWSIKLDFILSSTSYIHVNFQSFITLDSDQSLNCVAVASRSSYQLFTPCQFTYYWFKQLILILFLISPNCN